MADSMEKTGDVLLKALAMDEMYFGLKRTGWEPEDLKSYTEGQVENNFDRLDEFAGGELSTVEDPALREVLATMTVWRIAMLETGATGGSGGALKCRHDFVGACPRCAEEEKANRYGGHDSEAEEEGL